MLNIRLLWLNCPDFNVLGPGCATLFFTAAMNVALINTIFPFIALNALFLQIFSKFKRVTNSLGSKGLTHGRVVGVREALVHPLPHEYPAVVGEGALDDLVVVLCQLFGDLCGWIRLTDVKSQSWESHSKRNHSQHVPLYHW